MKHQPGFFMQKIARLKQEQAALAIMKKSAFVKNNFNVLPKLDRELTQKQFQLDIAQAFLKESLQTNPVNMPVSNKPPITFGKDKLDQTKGKAIHHVNLFKNQ